MTNRVLVCGGRNFDDVDYLYRKMGELRAVTPISLVISGHAPGADWLGEMWADENGIPVKLFPADWKREGRAAGPIRNQRMIDEGKPDLVVAFPGGRGTADMIRRARERGIEVIEVPSSRGTDNGRASWRP
jgi:hypothetical protein